MVEFCVGERLRAGAIRGIADPTVGKDCRESMADVAAATLDFFRCSIEEQDRWVRNQDAAHGAFGMQAGIQGGEVIGAMACIGAAGAAASHDTNTLVAHAQGISQGCREGARVVMLVEGLVSLGTASFAAGTLRAARFSSSEADDLLAAYAQRSLTSEVTESAADIGGAKFAQKSFTETFSKGGLFEGQSIDDLAASLRSGAVSAKDVPINVIVRDGTTLITNTRSAQALTRAGVPRDSWNVINRTGDPLYEGLLSGQLTRNALTSAGTELP